MNYHQIYKDIITRAKSRTCIDYTELHHIKPRCMGGSDEEDNIVALTAREHYLAHLLLIKIYPTNKSLWYAANMMANRNGRTYEFLRRQHAINVSLDHTGMKHTDEAKAKMKVAIAERWANNYDGFVEEQRRRASTPKKKKDGYFKPKTSEHARNISNAALKRPRQPCHVCGKLITNANIKNHMKVHTNDSV